jgi:hypothetical protein
MKEIKERMWEDFKPLYLKNGTISVVGYSEKTRIVYRDFEDFFFKDRHRYQTNEEKALERTEREERAEKSRFERAREITMAEYDGSQFFFNDVYYPTDEIDSFIDDCWCAGGADGLPKYVWAAKPEPVLKKRDAYQIYEDDLVDIGWVEIGWEDVKGVEELDAALAKFYQANEKFRVYYPDYSTAILIEDEVAEYLRDIDHD